MAYPDKVKPEVDPNVITQDGANTIPLGNKPWITPYYSLGREVCQNMYLELAQSEFSKSPYYLIKIPGLRRLNAIPTLTNYGACRGLFTTSSGKTISVNGNKVYELLRDGSKTQLGVINSYTGVVSMAENGSLLMAENGSLLMLVDGVNGWILRLVDNNFTQIKDEFFPGNDLGTKAPTYVTYNDTYFIVNIPNTNQYYYSWSYYAYQANNQDNTYDPAILNGYWTPLRSGQKIGKPDNIVTLINCNNYLWLLGYNSCEIHYDTGDTNGQQYARYQGALLNVGCNSPSSVAVFQNNIFFLGSDSYGTLGVYSNDGLNPIRISTRGIEQIIQEMSTYTDCQAYTYSQNGHDFYVMQFPAASRTFVFDMQTSSWHERTKLLSASGQLVRWDGMYATKNWDMLIMGDASTSQHYELDPTYYLNDSPLSNGVNYIKCVKSTPITFIQGKMIRYNWSQVVCNQGSGLITNTGAGVGVDPTLQISWSDDCGQTRSNERMAPIGKQGEYAKRSRVLSCGAGRNRVWYITMSDPVPFILVALLVDAKLCNF